MSSVQIEPFFLKQSAVQTLQESPPVGILHYSQIRPSSNLRSLVKPLGTLLQSFWHSPIRQRMMADPVPALNDMGWAVEAELALHTMACYGFDEGQTITRWYCSKHQPILYKGLPRHGDARLEAAEIADAL